MIDPLNDLLDDRAFVQIAGDVVGRSAGEFDAAFMGLVVGFRTLEAGQK